MWWHDNKEISSLSHPSADEGVQAIVNQLFIGTVTREFLGTKLQCRAQGSKMVAAVVKEVTVQVHCKWNGVQVMGEGVLLGAAASVWRSLETYSFFKTTICPILRNGLITKIIKRKLNDFSKTPPCPASLRNPLWVSR